MEPQNIPSVQIETADNGSQSVDPTVQVPVEDLANASLGRPDRPSVGHSQSSSSRGTVGRVGTVVSGLHGMGPTTLCYTCGSPKHKQSRCPIYKQAHPEKAERTRQKEKQKVRFSGKSTRKARDSKFVCESVANLEAERKGLADALREQARYEPVGIVGSGSDDSTTVEAVEQAAHNATPLPAVRLPDPEDDPAGKYRADQVKLVDLVIERNLTAMREARNFLSSNYRRFELVRSDEIDGSWPALISAALGLFGGVTFAYLVSLRLLHGDASSYPTAVFITVLSAVFALFMKTAFSAISIKLRRYGVEFFRTIDMSRCLLVTLLSSILACVFLFYLEVFVMLGPLLHAITLASGIYVLLMKLGWQKKNVSTWTFRGCQDARYRNPLRYQELAEELGRQGDRRPHILRNVDLLKPDIYFDVHVRERTYLTVFNFEVPFTSVVTRSYNLQPSAFRFAEMSVADLMTLEFNEETVKNRIRSLMRSTKHINDDMFELAFNSRMEHTCEAVLACWRYRMQCSAERGFWTSSQYPIVVDYVSGTVLAMSPYHP